MLRLFRQYYPIRNLLFVLIEGLFIYLSIFISSWIVQGTQGLSIDSWAGIRSLFITLTCQCSLYYNDLYDLQISESFSELSIRLMQSLGFSAIFLSAVYYFFPQLIVSSGVFALSIAWIIVFIVAFRFFYMSILSIGLFNQKIILLGSSKLARNIQEEIGNKKDCGYEIARFITAYAGISDGASGGRTSFDGPDAGTLCRIAKADKVKKIVVAMKERRGKFPTRALLECRLEGIEIIDGNSFYEMLTGKLLVDETHPAWLIFSDGFHKSFMRRMLKRLLDILVSLTMLILLFPLLMATAILIRIDSKGPVFFAQDRVGEKKKEYKVYKFRSMIADAEKLSGPVWAGENDDRVTRIGKYIRKLRIDELPQLWNVLKGDMSFVGPRPERIFFVNQLEKTIPYYGERFNVKPGITGWAQISYGYGASTEDAVEKLNYDFFYIKNMSFLMDLMIILRTAKTVLFGKGAR